MNIFICIDICTHTHTYIHIYLSRYHLLILFLYLIHLEVFQESELGKLDAQLQQLLGCSV